MQSALLIIVVIVAVVLLFLPSPISGMHPMRTPDTPINVLVITAIVDVTLSPLCPPLVSGHCVGVGVMRVLLLPLLLLLASPLPLGWHQWCDNTTFTRTSSLASLATSHFALAM